MRYITLIIIIIIVRVLSSSGVSFLGVEKWVFDGLGSFSTISMALSNAKIILSFSGNIILFISPYRRSHLNVDARCSKSLVVNPLYFDSMA